jgi:AmiR/NasT family two-component response regulator
VTRRVFLQPIITVCTKGESLAQLVRTTIAIAATEGRALNLDSSTRARCGSRAMTTEQVGHLRVLIANERRDRLELLAQVVGGLGHEVIAREVEVREVGAVTAREYPDVALVGLGLSSEHALELIAEIVHTATCPVIALLSARDPAYIREAAKRGVFAYIVDADAEELQSAIEITLQRFAEYHNLQGAFGRRAVIEQAKGILMARHAIDQQRAFQMLRSHSQSNGRKVADVAAAVVDSHLLLLAPLPQPAHAPDGDTPTT